MVRVVLCALLIAGCGDHTLRAVTGRSCADEPAQAACARDVWPNDLSRANSDAWLDAHAAGLRKMEPRLLVLDFHNALTLEAMETVVARQADALAEGSRYHGYADAEAPPFLRYQWGGLVDLRDDPLAADWMFSSSTRVPLDADGAFDVGALFAEPYTSWIGVEDPDEPGRLLGLCEQFERGLVHEVWLAVGDNAPGREPTPMIECKAARDDEGERVPGDAVATASASACTRIPKCGVTVRIAHLSPLRGVGCDLFVRGWAIEGSTRAIPYLARNATRYFNADLDSRYGAPASRLFSFCPPEPNTCVAYPTPNTLESALPDGPSFRFDDYGQGCGSVEFPPNGRFVADWSNTQLVDTRCEHYGLADADDGTDAVSSYSFDTTAALVADYPDCGGHWQIYWRQNMPGLDNRAIDVDGAPMKNWWPFLFF